MKLLRVGCLWLCSTFITTNSPLTTSTTQNSTTTTPFIRRYWPCFPIIRSKSLSFISEMFDKCKDIANEEKRKMLSRCRVFYEHTLPPFLRTFFEAKYIEFLATLTRHYIYDRVVPKVSTLKHLENPWISSTSRKVSLRSNCRSTCKVDL